MTTDTSTDAIVRALPPAINLVAGERPDRAAVAQLHAIQEQARADCHTVEDFAAKLIEIAGRLGIPTGQAGVPDLDALLTEARNRYLAANKAVRSIGSPRPTT